MMTIEAPFPILRNRRSRSLVGGLGLFLGLLLVGRPSFSQTLAFGETNPQFGTVVVGEKGEPKVISIVNASNAPILLTGIAVTQDFAEGNECPIWLPEGDGCRIYVTFTPSQAGQITGEMRVRWTGRKEQAIPLMGFGISGKGSAPLPPEGVTPAARTTNDEERAAKLIDDRMSHSTYANTRRYIYSSIVSKDPAVIAADEKIFSLTNDTVWKERVAAILIKLGIKDAVYSDYLRKQAEKSLAHDRDIPMVGSYDSNRMPKGVNPDAIKWCHKNRVDGGDAYNITYFEISEAWSALAAAQDPRNYDLLVEGLHSANILIPGIAAGGLALLQDARAIPELISAGHRVPADGLGDIVQALLCFPDPKAQAAAWDIIPDPEKAKEKPWFDGSREQIKQQGPHAFFGWG